MDGKGGFNLMEMGLALQAASIGKSITAPAPTHTFRSPIESVCPCCGDKFTGISCRREGCNK